MAESVQDGLCEKLRIEKLEYIKENETPIITGILLPYKGENKPHNVYRIPLSYLVYNPYNGRIGTRVKTFEVRSHKLNPENAKDIEIIEKYLWESKEKKNKDTMEDLIKHHQRQFGIVSKNGFIIDGNRRASLLNRIYRDRANLEKSYKTKLDHAEYFDAIILDDNADEKEILKLETTYQMGMDEKLDYNPTEKYLKCFELKRVGYSESDISKMMRISEKKVAENLEILKVMNEYLEYNDYKDMYSMLDGREDHLINTNKALKAYQQKTANAYTDWAPEDYDIEMMKHISFDYIRAKYEGKDFRYIIQNGRKVNSFFANSSLWKTFSENHFKTIESVKEENVEEYLNKKNGTADVTDILATRDIDWQKKVYNELKGNFEKHKRKLEDFKQADRPVELLGKALDSLEAVDEKQESLIDGECLDIVKLINSLGWDIMKIIEAGLKNERKK